MLDNNNDGAAVPARTKGRPKGSLNRRTLFAREWCDKLGLADPVEFLIKCMNADTIEVTQADAAGKAVLDSENRPVKQMLVVPLDTRIQCARELIGYMYPRLQATELSGQLDVPVELHLPTAEILKNPQLSGALQDLAMLVAQSADSTSDDQQPHTLPAGVRACMLGLDR
jgi:hypothetical protein